MSTKDHPNNAPGVPMKFPVWSRTSRSKYINPMIRPIARHMPGVAVIGIAAVNLGPSTRRWCQHRQDKVLAILLAARQNRQERAGRGEADIHVARQDLHLVNPESSTRRDRRPIASAYRSRGRTPRRRSFRRRHLLIPGP